MSNKIEQQDFEDLPFDQQCEIVKKSPFAEKGELILRSQHPEELIEEMGPENFYIIARSVDREQLPELLSFAFTDQLLFYTDFYCFERDEISRERFIEWITFLMEASEEKFIEWIDEMDFDFVVSGYKKIIRVIKSNPEEVMDEVLQDEEYFSIDFLYHICIRSEDDFQTIKKSVELLFELRKSYYINLMECVIAEITAETEEEAFINREERLSEAGFPEKEIAINIYLPLSDPEMEGLEKKSEGERLPVAENRDLAAESSFMTPVLTSQKNLFIDDVLTVLSETHPHLRDEIDAEIMALANKVLVLSMKDNYDLSEDMLKKALREVKGTLNIALCVLSKTQVRKAVDILTCHWIEHIFRRGFAEIAPFRRKANALAKKFRPVNMEAFFRFFEAPYGQTLQGFLSLSPSLYDPNVTDNLTGLREFQTLDDIAAAQNRLTAVSEVMEILSRIDDFGMLFDKHAALSIRPDEITADTVFFTAFANFVLSGNVSARPLVSADIARFHKKAFARPSSGGSSLNKEMTDAFSQLIGEMSQEKEGPLMSFIREILKRGEEELSRFDASKAPDARYIRSLGFLIK